LVARSLGRYRQRGVGKTPLCGEQAALFDYRRYVLFSYATAGATCSSFNSIKADLDANDLNC
jgi:hypothetical protein